MGDRSSTIPGLARRAFLQLSVAGSGAFGVRELFAAEPQANVEDGAPADRAGARSRAHVRRALRRRSPEPHRLPARRSGRRHGVPGGHGRLLARLAAPPARRLQQPADVRRARREGPSRAGARAGSAGARVEAVRRPRHRQRRRRHLLRPAAPRQRHVPGPLPVRDGGDARSASAARGHADRLEPVRAERSRRVQPAGRRPRIPHRQPRPHAARCRVLVPRPQLHGRARQAAGGARARRRLRAVGRRRQGQAVGGRQLRRRRRRAGHDGRSRLVPRRLVGSADADVEGGDRRRDRRASTGHRRAAGAGRIAVRAGDARARGVAHDPREARLVRAAEPSAQRQGSGRRRDRSRQGLFPRLVRRTLRQPRRARRALAHRVRRPARALAALQRVPARHDAAAGGDRGGRRQPVDPQVADRAAPGRRTDVGLGGLQRRQRLLPRHLHARVELRAGGAAPVPVARADAARDRVRPVAGRHRPPDVPRRAADPARSSTTSTPPRTDSSAASSRCTATGASAATPSGCARCGRR